MSEGRRSQNPFLYEPIPYITKRSKSRAPSRTQSAPVSRGPSPYYIPTAVQRWGGVSPYQLTFLKEEMADQVPPRRMSALARTPVKQVDAGVRRDAVGEGEDEDFEAVQRGASAAQRTALEAAQLEAEDQPEGGLDEAPGEELQGAAGGVGQPRARIDISGIEKRSAEEAKLLGTRPRSTVLSRGREVPQPRPATAQGLTSRRRTSEVNTGALKKRRPLETPVKTVPTGPDGSARRVLQLSPNSVFRPIVNAPTTADRTVMEWGEYSPPPLGSRPASGVNTGANTPSRGPSRREVTTPAPARVEGAFTPVNWQTPFLQLQGNLGDEARRQARMEYRERILRDENIRRIEEATEEARDILYQQTLEAAALREEQLLQQQEIAIVNTESMARSRNLNVDMRGPYLEVDRQRRRVEAAARAAGDPDQETERDVISEVSEEMVGGNLYRPFMRLSKVAYRMNDPNTRDDPDVQERNKQHLRRLTTEEVERGLERSLQPHTERLQEAMVRTIGTVVGNLESRILETVEREVGERLKRVEENEQLSSRVHVEKKDEVRVLDVYPPEPGASNEAYQRAIMHSVGVVKVIERTVTFQAQKFNFVYLLCKESNKIASNFGLSKNQQLELIYSHIPPGPVSEILKIEPDLVTLFKIVSTYSTIAVTKQSLEKQINKWKLNISSVEAMNDSIMNLLDLLNKSREDYGIAKPDTHSLFLQVIAQINRSEKLPTAVYDKLFEARLRVHEDDKFWKILQVIGSICHLRLRTERKVTTKAITYVPDSQLEKLTAQVQAIALQAKPDQKQQQPKKEPMQDGQSTEKKKGKKGNFKKRKYGFVTPWPEDKPYLSKSGNALRAEFEEHFREFCHKCGHSKHRAPDCLIYPEKTVILTLCKVCRQGLHEVCKSKRPDLVKKQEKPDPQVKAVQTYQELANLQQQMLLQQQAFYQAQQVSTPGSGSKKKKKDKPSVVANAITVESPDLDSD